MDSRNAFGVKLRALVCVILVAGLAACSGKIADDHDSDYTIGVKPQSISSMTAADGTESQSVVIFDKMLRRIHQFDIANMSALRTFAVRSPEEEHFVVNGKNGNYIIDLSLKGLTIFNKYNQANYNPIRFQGKPKGIFFDDTSNVFGIYDDQMTVGLISLDANGEVTTPPKALGAAVLPNSSAVIAAGDVDSSGQMILSMSDGNIVVVDILNTLKGIGANAVGWSLARPPFATGLTDIMWLAPLPLTAPGASRLVIARSSNKISIIDTVAGTVLESYVVDGTVEKVSKSPDPHVVIRKGNNITLVYARAGVLETKSFILTSGSGTVNSILSSSLNIAKDTWSFVDSTARIYSIFNDIEETHAQRRFKRYSLTRRICTHNLAVAEEPQVEFSDSFIFGLFRDELGYAERTNVDTEEVRTVERFNLRYIPAH